VDTLITATASCAAGKVALGGGGQVTTTDVPDKVQLIKNIPSSTSQWTTTATVAKALASGKTATVTAYVLCSQ
jgi:hypothetical protein